MDCKTIAVIVISILIGIGIGYVAFHEDEDVVGYSYGIDNNWGAMVSYEVFHESAEPVWVTAEVDGHKVTLKDGDRILASPGESFSLTFSNPTDYGNDELKDHITLYFDGVEGKRLRS